MEVEAEVEVFEEREVSFVFRRRKEVGAMIQLAY